MTILEDVGPEYLAFSRDGWDVEELNLDQEEQAYRAHNNLMLQELPVSGKTRKTSWEYGWGQNFEKLKIGAKDALIPAYFGKYEYIRFQSKFYRTNDPLVELQILRALILGALECYSSDLIMNRVIEFGCGTGHNLFFLANKFRDCQFVGSDWSEASSKIISLAQSIYATPNVFAGPRFDYFNPDINFEVRRTDIVLTVASLEQVGNKFVPFLDYLISNPVRRVINIEPEASLLDSSSRFDSTSLNYMKKRGYLNGFLSELRRREKIGELRILKAIRSPIGSFPFDGYSLFVWEPVNAR